MKKVLIPIIAAIIGFLIAYFTKDIIVSGFIVLILIFIGYFLSTRKKD